MVTITENFNPLHHWQEVIKRYAIEVHKHEDYIHRGKSPRHLSYKDYVRYNIQNVRAVRMGTYNPFKQPISICLLTGEQKKITKRRGKIV